MDDIHQSIKVGFGILGSLSGPAKRTADTYFFFFFHQLSPPVGEFGLVDTYPGRPHGMQGFDPRHWVLPEHNCPRSLHFRLYSVWLGACYRLFMYFDFNFTFSQIKDCIEFVVFFFFFCFSFAYSFFFLWSSDFQAECLRLPRVNSSAPSPVVTYTFLQLLTWKLGRLWYIESLITFGSFFFSSRIYPLLVKTGLMLGPSR